MLYFIIISFVITYDFNDQSKSNPFDCYADTNFCCTQEMKVSMIKTIKFQSMLTIIYFINSFTSFTSSFINQKKHKIFL